jgi:hypothetical protein
MFKNRLMPPILLGIGARLELSTGLKRGTPDPADLAFVN